MGPGRLIGLLLIGIGSFGVRAGADLKAVFAFSESVVSIRLPELNYEILTTVDEYARKVAVRFPTGPSDGEDSLPPHLEMRLEALAADADGLDYYQHYLKLYVDTMGSTYASVDDSKPIAMALPDCHMVFLFFSDSELKAHKALLITAIYQGIGIVILLDTLAELYDAHEDISIGIVQSIQFEK